MATSPISRSAYPSRLQKATSQRTPISYISGNAINNNTGAVKSNRSVSLASNVNEDHTNKTYGPVLVNNEEFGATTIESGSFPAAVNEIFANNVTKSPANTGLHFSRDISAAPISSGGWDYKSKQRESLRSVNTFGSELLPNGTFNEDLTGWTATGGTEWGAVGPSNVDGVALVDGSLSIASIPISTGIKYRLTIITADPLTRLAPEFNENAPITVEIYKTSDSTPAITPVVVSRLGTNYIDFVVSVTDADYTVKMTTTSEAYVSSISLRQVLSEDINVTFGNQTDVATFANGKTQAQRVF